MIDNLVIVESPAKARTIEKFLGKEFQVKSSMGHIRDLSKKDLGIDIKSRYKPKYIIPDDKKKVVSELKKLVKEAKTVWLASDEDREGEAIAWHLCEALNLNKENTRRIVFHEITRNAITNAIKNHRGIDYNLVDAQQARRILDRLVGFELSPILWKKVKPALSAGRVQSVAVRLIVEREREILNFKYISYFKISAIFKVKDKNNRIYELKAEIQDKIESEKEVLELLEKFKIATFTITDITKKPSRKTPSPPFTTSTLQQEASRKLGFSVSQTMTIAQRLYEAGKITYMRTDSVNLSDTALHAVKEVVSREYGDKYLNIRKYKTKSKSAQEAHEAIRPAYPAKQTISGNNAEKKLYDLIWKRTIASQMSDALIEKTTVTIDISNANEKFLATGEILTFDGFLKLYIESTDDEVDENSKGLLPPLSVNDLLIPVTITATEKFTSHPPRYTEASLVKKLEELGIGRPSTYAPTISTIQQRGYVIKQDKAGYERKYILLELTDNNINKEVNTEYVGTVKAKLFPDNIGMIVNDFLVRYFSDILNYNFTATIEEEFDEIASGKKNWTDMIDRFYKQFHPKVVTTLTKSEPSKGDRHLGEDPETGKPVIVKMGRYGAMAQIGENTSKDNEEKPRFASLRKGQNMESITLEEALQLFSLPRNIGQFDGKDLIVSIGRFGPYIKHDSKFYSLKKGVDDPYSIDIERAVEIIKEKQEKDKNKIIKSFKEEPELMILNGRWGPYITYKKKNFRVPKKTDPNSLSYEDCIKIIKEVEERKKSPEK
ncbi:MAG: type I DNA topoisomerase [Bacteroidales bacterium]|nr:MAG: type I DNA topoisomerase [Bacteroidales bacterium]